MPEPEAIRRKIDAAGQDVGHRDRTKLWKVCFNGFRRIYYYFFFTAMRTSAAGHKTPHRKPREKKIHIINACWSVSSKIMELPVVPVLVWQAHDFHPQPAHEAAWEQECFETPLSWWRIFFFFNHKQEDKWFSKNIPSGESCTLICLTFTPFFPPLFSSLVPSGSSRRHVLPPHAELRLLPLLTLFVLPQSSNKSMTNKLIFSEVQTRLRLLSCRITAAIYPDSAPCK